METFNLFKNPVLIYFRGENRHSHWSGIVGSFCFSVIFVIALVFFGMDFYLRENPVINIFKQDLEDFREVLPEIEHNPKVIIALEKEISSQIQIIFFDFGLNFSDEKQICTDQELQGKIERNDFLDYFCVDLKNLQLNPDLQSFLTLLHCSNAGLKRTPIYDSLDLSNCQAINSEEEELLFGRFVRIYYSSANLKMDQYDNPISYSYNEYVTGFLKNRLVTYVLLSQVANVLDDKGWIFASETDNLALDSSFYLESILEQNDFQIRMNLRFQDSIEVNKRIYMKVQNLAATVGGFLKALLIMIKIPLDFVCRESMNANYIQDFMTPRKEEDQGDNSPAIPTHRKIVSSDRTNLNSPMETHQIEEIRKEETTQPKEKISLKYFLFRLFPWKSKTSSINNALKGAERLFKRVVSVEYMFKSFFEFQVMKKIVLSEEERQLLKIIRNPNVFNMNCPISKHYLSEVAKPEEEREEIRKKKAELIEKASDDFKEAINEYL